MNKRLNKGIIVAGVIALLFIWVCLAFNNVDWAVLYAWILIGGGILVLVATNIIILAAKNGENEMFEPKITKEEMLEFVKDKGLIMSWEDINSLKNTSNCSPVDLNEIATALKTMGYKVTDVYDNYIEFNDENDKYCLTAGWRYASQLNYLGVFLSYTINKEDVEVFSKIAQNVTEGLKIVKMHISTNDGAGYSIDVLADSFCSGRDSLNATLLTLLDFVNTAINRFRDLKSQVEREKSTVDFSKVEEQMALNQNKTKYEC